MNVIVLFVALYFGKDKVFYETCMNGYIVKKLFISWLLKDYSIYKYFIPCTVSNILQNSVLNRKYHTLV